MNPVSAYRTRIVWLLILLAGAVCHAKGVFGRKGNGRLDTEAIQRGYENGDFSLVSVALEEYLKTQKEASFQDTVVCLKFLSIIYASDVDTEAKAKRYMARLVRLSPTVELHDLFPSDKILAMFKETKTQYREEQDYLKNRDFFGKLIRTDTTAHVKDSLAVQDSLKKVAASKKKSRKWVWWTVGGVGTAAVATGIFLYIHEDKTKASSVSMPL